VRKRRECSERGTVIGKLNSVAGWRGQEHTTSGVGAISGSGDCPANAPDLAQSKNRSGAARVMPPQNAVAIARSANPAMHG
jgi:hypothetical protein